MFVDHVRYCDCGCEEFTEISSLPETKSPSGKNPGEVVSVIIFVLCVIGAILIWFV